MGLRYMSIMQSCRQKQFSLDTSLVLKDNESIGFEFTKKQFANQNNKIPIIIDRDFSL